MSCNAHGHPPNCNCGWGGEFHAKTDGKFPLDYWTKVSNHTNPNAKCPICKEKVFFFRSADGGSVYFDELGPPWPKHPCTDKGSTSNINTKQKIYNKNGWWPFLCKLLGPLSNKEGIFLIDTEERILFAKTKYGTFRPQMPIWIRALSGGGLEYEVSTLVTKHEKIKPIVHKAYNPKALTDMRFAINFQETIKNLNKEIS